MSSFQSGNAPGFQAAQESRETQVTWSGRGGQTLQATRRAIIDSAVVDAGNTPTTTLRGGHVLALADATGRAHLYDPDANDGKQIAAGILEQAQDMLQNGVAAHRFVQMLVHGLLKDSEVLGLDPRAKQQLAARFLLANSPEIQPGVLMHPRGVYRQATNRTLTAADNGLLFIATAAVTFTLPTKENGLAFRFLQAADADMTITGSSDIVHRNTVSASNIAFNTSSQKIGSHVLFECMYTAADTLKWVVSNLGGTTASIT